LDPPAEGLRHRGHVLDRGHRDPELAQERRRAAARNELDVERNEAAGELLEPRLVVDRDERAPDHAVNSRTTRGSSRCSTACTRARSVFSLSPGSTGTGSAAITGPVSTPPST